MQRTGAFTLIALACCSAPVDSRSQKSASALTLLHISDLHSHLFPFADRIGYYDARRGLGEQGAITEVGGVARLSSLIRRERTRSAASLLFDSGDAVEGTHVYAAFEGRAELVALGGLGVDAHVLGNHDLEAGLEAALHRYERHARFAFLAANRLPLADTGLPVPGFRIFHTGGLRVGVGGIANLSDGSGDSPAREKTETAQAVIDALRPFSDLIVLLTHQGVDADVALVRATSGAHVVLGGHQHLVLDEPRVVFDCAESAKASQGCASKPVLVVHSGAYGRYLGVLELELQRAELSPQGLEITAHRYRALPVNADVPEDPALVELLTPFAPVVSADTDWIAYAPSPIERFAVTGGDSALGNLVTDAVRAELGTELFVINSSSLRADIPAGPVTRSAFSRAIPFDDTALLVSISGAELADFFARAAAGTRQRDCESTLQLAGARWVLACQSDAFALESWTGECLAGGCGVGSAARPFALGVSEYVFQHAGPHIGVSEPRALARSSRSIPNLVLARIQGAAPCEAAPTCRSEVARILEHEQQRSRGMLVARAVSSEVEARGLCATLPCLDGRIGAARDGRIVAEGRQ